MFRLAGFSFKALVATVMAGATLHACQGPAVAAEARKRVLIPHHDIAWYEAHAAYRRALGRVCQADRAVSDGAWRIECANARAAENGVSARDGDAALRRLQQWQARYLASRGW